MATYYVVASGGSDSNPGTSAQPWATISHAALVVAAGDTVNVGPGAYSDRPTLNASGTASAPITFSGPVTALVYYGWIVNGNWITINGFGVGDPISGGWGPAAIQLSGSNIIIDGCKMQMNIVHNMGDAKGPVGIKIDGSNCIVRNCDITGLWWNNVFALGGTNNQILNNVSHDQSDVDFLQMWGTGHIIRGNEVYNHDNPHSASSPAFHSDFIQTFGDGSLALNSSAHIIENNYVHDSAIQVGNLEQDNNLGIKDWTLRNNIFVNVASSLFSGIPQLKLFNNIFYTCGSFQAQPVIFYGIPGSYDSTGAQVLNNIFLFCGSTPASPSIGAIGTNGFDLNSIVIDHNYFGGTSYAAKGSGAFIGTNPVNGGNPNFVSEPSKNFHLNSPSILIDAGVALASFNVDRDGLARPAGAGWDIGPYEYGGRAPTPPTPIPPGGGGNPPFMPISFTPGPPTPQKNVWEDGPGLYVTPATQSPIRYNGQVQPTTVFTAGLKPPTNRLPSAASSTESKIK